MHQRPLISERHSLTVNHTETELLKCNQILENSTASKTGPNGHIEENSCGSSLARTVRSLLPPRSSCTKHLDTVFLSCLTPLHYPINKHVGICLWIVCLVWHVRVSYGILYWTTEVGYWPGLAGKTWAFSWTVTEEQSHSLEPKRPIHLANQDPPLTRPPWSSYWQCQRIQKVRNEKKPSK